MFKKLLVLLHFPFFLCAQLSGTLTVPGTYASLNAAITDLNLQGVSGPLTILVASSHTEVVPSGGYSLYASGSAQNGIQFLSNSSLQKPLLMAPSNGNRTPASSSQDGIWRCIGCDYITIDGFELRDTNSFGTQTMEFGFGLFKSSVTNGCQFVTIRNCKIQLNQMNNASGNLPACDGSRGIEMVNALSSAHTTSLQITSPSGAHCNNSFYSNIIEQCNYGFSLIGFGDNTPFQNADRNNRIGGNGIAFTNTIVNFGGGGINPSAAIRVQSQYSCVVSNNLIVSSSSTTNLHAGTLRGIYFNQAPEASSEITSNTITVKSNSSSAQLIAIENQSGTNGTNNLIKIQDNVIEKCSHGQSVSGSFYGIYNTASSSSLTISNNRFIDNSSTAQSGSNYLIYSNAAISSQLEVSTNTLQFIFEGVQAYSGNFACIYTAGASSTSRHFIINNVFQNIVHRPIAGTGTIYFIENTSDVYALSINNNVWADLHLNHAANQYCIYNASSTSNSLTVSSNTVVNYHRMVGGNFYFYYANSTSPGTATHAMFNNSISDVSADSGLGTFYGIYNAEGNSTPFPRKLIYDNCINNIAFNSASSVFGIYLGDLGDAGTSSASLVHGNIISNLQSADNVYGLYLATSYSPLIPAAVYENTIRSLVSNGSNGSVYGAYLSSNNAGPVFYRNRIFDLSTLASTGSVCGIYAANTGTYVIHHNIISELNAINANGANRVNGIYLNTGTLVRMYYNTVRIDATSSAANFGSNALYTSITPSLELRNNILINLSTPTGTGICSAYRRSSNSLATYSLNSNNNVFFAGTPASNKALFYNGSTSYSTLAQFQTAVNPRENASYDQNQMFQSSNGWHPLFLHSITNQTSVIESGAATIASFSLDADNELRQGFAGYLGSGTAPDVGADEFQTNVSPCSAVNPATITTNTNSVCATNSATLFAVALSQGTGLSYQWKSSNAGNGPFLNVTAGSGANSLEYSTILNSPGVYYYRLESSCSVTNSTAVSNVLSVTVFPNPTVAISTNSILCAGASLSLNASGVANQYYWLGPAAFTSHSQNPIIANVPGYAAGIYSLVATSGPCSSPIQTISISVVQFNVNVSATPSIICVGSASTLSAIGNATNYIWNNTLNGSSVTVFPSQSNVYTVQANGLANCYRTYTLFLGVVSPTIQAMNGTACLPNTTATCGVQSFTPAFISWYSSIQSVTPFSYGATLSVNSANSSTFFARAALLSSVTVTSPLNGTSSAPSIMFDVVPQTNFVLNGIDLHLAAAGVSSVAIWTRLGSFSNYTNTSNGWNLLCSGTLQALGANLLSTNNLNFVLPVYSSQTQAFCISVLGNSLQTGTSASPTQTWTNAPFNTMSGMTGNVFNVSGPPRQFEGAFRIANELCSTNRVPVSINISTIPLLSLVASSSIVCPGQTATVSASGASTYTWLNGSTSNTLATVINTPQLIYVVGVNQASCSATASIQILNYSLSPIAIQASAVSICPNSKISFTASGASTYTWNNGPNGAIMSAFPNTSTSYTVYGRNSSGCMSQQTITALTRTVPLVQILSPTINICKGTMVALKALGALTYTWLPSFSVGDTITVQPFVNTVYNVIGTGVNSCTNIAFMNLSLDDCTDLKSDELAFLKVYYYFEHDVLTLQASHDFTCSLINPLGKTLLTHHDFNTLQKVDMSAFSPGVYLIRGQSGKQYFSLKIVYKPF